MADANRYQLTNCRQLISIDFRSLTFIGWLGRTYWHNHSSRSLYFIPTAITIKKDEMWCIPARVNKPVLLAFVGSSSIATACAGSLALMDAGISFFEHYLRNNYRVMVTRVEVWENEKSCGKTTRR